MEGRSITQKNLRNLCCDHGIKHQFTPAWTPQQNEILERKNKIIVDIARSMLF
jgi:transposase InsO family protein